MIQCKYRVELTGKEKQQMGLGPVKRWGLCLADSAPLKGERVVCSCSGCGRRCPGYTPPSDHPISIVDPEDHES